MVGEPAFSSFEEGKSILEFNLLIGAPTMRHKVS